MRNLFKISAVAFWLGVAAYFIVGLATVNAQYYTGDKPYISIFGWGEKDYSSKIRLKFNNTDENASTLVIMKDDKVIDHVQIDGGDSWTFKYVPSGKYTYKFANEDSYFESNRIINLDPCGEKMNYCGQEIDFWVERSSYGAGGGKISKGEFFSK